MADRAQPFNPAVKFGELLAARVEWTPMAQGAASYRTHELVFLNDRLLELRPTRMERWFGLPFACFGLIWAGLLFTSGTQQPPGLRALLLIVLIPVSATGLYLGTRFMQNARRPIEVDLAAQRFVKRRVSLFGKEIPGFDLALSALHAVQVVPTGDSYDFTAYELNLVLHDASRVHVICHAYGAMLEADASMLASKLGLPLWVYETP